MALQPDGMETLVGEVLSVKGECSAGHKAGDVFHLGCWDTGGICGFFYHDIFPNISVLQFGGGYPWAAQGELILECPDRYNAVTMRLRKRREDE